MKKEEWSRITFTPEQPIALMMLAHGAGAGNEHEFMMKLSSQLSQQDVLVISFNFPYMQSMYAEGKRKPPNKSDILIEHFQSEIDAARQYSLPIFIAGKSMGGRIATMINAHPSKADTINGCLVYGYPFIPPGKPEKYEERTTHLYQQISPLLICQGERDTFGNKALLSEKTLFSADESVGEIAWINDGDHSFKPRKSAGIDVDQNIEQAVLTSTEFIKRNI